MVLQSRVKSNLKKEDQLLERGEPKTGNIRFAWNTQK